MDSALVAPGAGLAAGRRPRAVRAGQAISFRAATGESAAISNVVFGDVYVYSVDIGLLHLVVLDFNVYYGSEPHALRVQQLEWLEADLSRVNRDRTRTPWVLATAHMPIQCSSITVRRATL
jgi:hypothetical protein